MSASCPFPTPVPESERFVTAFDASLSIVTVALKEPAALGVKFMLRVVLCPAPIAAGRLGAVTEKYFVDTEALLIVTDLVPEFVAVTVSVLLPPAVTFPKLTLKLPRARLPFCVGPELAALTP